jgi:hypothetical protein
MAAGQQYANLLNGYQTGLVQFTDGLPYLVFAPDTQIPNDGFMVGRAQ